MQNNLQKYLAQIEKTVAEIKFPENPSSLYSPMLYILSLGGKRMRPVLTLMACDAFAGNTADAKNASLAVELFHNFSLIHDDIMDKAPLRRGEPTVHHKWNENIAILSGDGMLIESYKYLNQYPAVTSQRLISLFNKTAIEVCEGQQMDMDFETEEKVSIDSYLEMIRLKTAVLLGCSLQMGAIVAGASEENQSDIYNFGVNLGIAFQLQDDILDLYADQAKFGKQVGGDIIANKKTYLLLKAMEDANPLQLSSLNSILKMTNASEKIAHAKVLFSELGIKEKTEEKMNSFYQIAMTNLEHLNISDVQKIPLKELALYLMNREK